MHSWKKGIELGNKRRTFLSCTKHIYEHPTTTKYKHHHRSKQPISAVILSLSTKTPQHKGLHLQTCTLFSKLAMKPTTLLAILTPTLIPSLTVGAIIKPSTTIKPTLSPSTASPVSEPSTALGAILASLSHYNISNTFLPSSFNNTSSSHHGTKPKSKKPNKKGGKNKVDKKKKKKGGKKPKNGTTTTMTTIATTTVATTATATATLTTDASSTDTSPMAVAPQRACSRMCAKRRKGLNCGGGKGSESGKRGTEAVKIGACWTCCIV